MQRMKYKAKVTPNPHPARAVADGKVSGRESQLRPEATAGRPWGWGCPCCPAHLCWGAQTPATSGTGHLS